MADHITVTVWIPAILTAVAAVLLAVYAFYIHGGPGEMRPPGGRRPEGSGEILKTLGTVAIFLGVAGLSWFWFKKRRRSRSLLVRQAGKLLYAVHKLLGWATLLIITVHGTYFLLTKPGDDKMLGLSARS